MDIDDQIRFEPEGTALDFKKTQYAKNRKVDLLKDVAAMANADVAGPRRIILGVKKRPDGSYDVPGIPAEEFVESAEWEQLVHDNIEPQIHMTYRSHKHEDVLVGVIEIEKCDSQPYVVRKGYEPLRLGEIWIRKGTRQMSASRADLERMYASRARGFDGDVRFEWFGGGSELSLVPLEEDYELPSKRAEKEIRGIVTARQQGVGRGVHESVGLLGQLVFLGDTIPRSARSTEELEKELATISARYRDSDLYDVLERHAHQINVMIRNEGTEYIEDATLELVAPRTEGFFVVSELVEEPQTHVWRSLALGNVGGPYYPEVESRDDVFVVTQHLGNLPHGVTREAFDVALRVQFARGECGTKHDVRLSLRARNLPAPITSSLVLRCETDGKRLRPIDGFDTDPAG